MSNRKLLNPPFVSKKKKKVDVTLFELWTGLGYETNSSQIPFSQKFSNINFKTTDASKLFFFLFVSSNGNGTFWRRFTTCLIPFCSGSMFINGTGTEQKNENRGKEREINFLRNGTKSSEAWNRNKNFFFFAKRSGVFFLRNENLIIAELIGARIIFLWNEAK